MTVNLTRIYTRLGDAGQTHLGDMSRVSKLDARVEAYGTVDELNATLGLAVSQPQMPERFRPWLRRIQNDLLDLGADLCVPPENPDQESSARQRLRITGEYTEWLEQACDEINAKLEPLHSFVIPGASLAGAHLHVCRTVCRRAERRVLAIGEPVSPEALRYLNRLSDLLFILSRAVDEQPEALWNPGGHTGTLPPPA